MSMTLGFGVLDFLTAYLNTDEARDVLIAIAKHAPDGKLIRAGGEYSSNGYEPLEIANGVISAADPSIGDAMKKADFASWSNDDAPEGLAPLILPGTGWKIDELIEEPALVKLIAENQFCRSIQDTTRARLYVNRQGREIFKVADKHRLLTVFQ